MLKQGDANPVNHPSLNYLTVRNALNVCLCKLFLKKMTSFVWKVHPWGSEKLLLRCEGFCEGDFEKWSKEESLELRIRLKLWCPS